LRTWLAALLVALGLCVGAQAQTDRWNSSTAAQARRERIEDFDSRVEVRKNGDMEVTETIDVLATDEEIRHGLLRDFPTTYRDNDGLLVKVDFDVHEVTLDGRPETYTREYLGNGVRMRIGSADATLEPGRHRFTIRYRTSRQPGFLRDADELYWNVTGNGWTFPINHATASIQLPDSTPILRSSFYTGPQGADGKNARVTSRGDGRITFETTAPLGVGEGLTVAAAWRKGVVQAPSQLQVVLGHLRDNLHVVIAVLGSVLLAAYYAWVFVATRRRTPKRVVPLYEPPGGMSAAAVHFMVLRRHDKQTFTLALMEMIALRAMRIDNSAASPRFRLLDETDQSRHGMQRDNLLAALLAKLFRKDDSFSKQDGRERFSDAQSLLGSQLEIRFDKYFELHRPLVRRGLWLWLLLLAACIATAWFTDQDDGRGVMLFVPFLAVPLACLTFAYGGLRARELHWGAALLAVFFIVPFQIAAVLMLLRDFGEVPLRALPIVLPVLLFPLVIRAYSFVKTYTPDGFRLMDEVAGFKRYLALTEGPRLEALATTDEKLHVYERYLPYAIALGVGRKWAAVFAGLAGTVAGMAAVQAMHQYYGGHDLLTQDPSVGAHGISADIAAGSSGTVSSSSGAPGSSGSWSSGSDSSSSGSDGGGGSGDGGGGGGGSGW
jgi:uncharacterized membrane protein YgcG